MIPRLLLLVEVSSHDTKGMGWNKILLKIENNLGGYAFYARIPDIDHALVFSPTRPR